MLRPLGRSRIALRAERPQKKEGGREGEKDLVIIPGVCIGTKWKGAYLSKVLGDRQALLQTI